MTQKQLVMAWVEEHGSITPAKMAGTIYNDTMFGSETSKRCRELRSEGKLTSETQGKFEVFYLVIPKEKYTGAETCIALR